MIRKITVTSAQEQGRRAEQQDDFVIATHKGSVLCVVADGLGGEPHGAEASALFVRTARECFEKNGNHYSALEDAMLAVHRARRGMTTFVAAYVPFHHAQWCEVFSLGDSSAHVNGRKVNKHDVDERGYITRCAGDGRLYPLLAWRLDEEPYKIDLFSDGVYPSEAYRPAQDAVVASRATGDNATIVKIRIE